MKNGRGHTKPYSPAASDVWALAHILLNMVTGRRIWTKPSRSNQVYRNYLKAPYAFFLAAHPISAALNELVVQVLDPNPAARLSLKEFKEKFGEIESFYAPGVVFENGRALSEWNVEPKQTEVSAPVGNGGGGQGSNLTEAKPAGGDTEKAMPSTLDFARTVSTEVYKLPFIRGPAGVLVIRQSTRYTPYC